MMPSFACPVSDDRTDMGDKNPAKEKMALDKKGNKFVIPAQKEGRRKKKKAA